MSNWNSTHYSNDRNRFDTLSNGTLLGLVYGFYSVYVAIWDAMHRWRGLKSIRGWF
jgi:hypothetical protein